MSKTVDIDNFYNISFINFSILSPPSSLLLRTQIRKIPLTFLILRELFN